MRIRKRRCCSSSVMENQYLISTMPERTSMRSNSGTELEKLLVFGVRAEAHHPLDARAVVPAAVEQHDFAAGGQMRDVALEIPLAALALVRRRQRRDAADARIEPLRDALDDAALARGIAPLEDHHDFELLMHDPVLQLDQFALQPQQLLEIEFPVQRLLFGMVGDFIITSTGDRRRFPAPSLRRAIDQLAVDAAVQSGCGGGTFSRTV